MSASLAAVGPIAAAFIAVTAVAGTHDAAAGTHERPVRTHVDLDNDLEADHYPQVVVSGGVFSRQRRCDVGRLVVITVSSTGEVVGRDRTDLDAGFWVDYDASMVDPGDGRLTATALRTVRGTGQDRVVCRPGSETETMRLDQRH